jgi:hypothetical protein
MITFVLIYIDISQPKGLVFQLKTSAWLRFHFFCADKRNETKKNRPVLSLNPRKAPHFAEWVNSLRSASSTAFRHPPALIRKMKTFSRAIKRGDVRLAIASGVSFVDKAQIVED